MIEIQVKEETNYRRVLNQAEKLLRSVKNLSPIVKEWAEDYNALTERNWNKKGNLYQQGGWPELKESTKRDKERKGFGGKRILERTGELNDRATNAKGSYTRGKIILTWILPEYWKYHQHLDTTYGRPPQRAIIADEDGNIPKRAIVQLIRLLDKKISRTLPGGVL